jgi:ribonuclease HII
MSILKSTYHPVEGKTPDEIILECGADEAGVGCLAGPVVSAAVIWPYELDDEFKDCEEYHLLKDSKKLTEKQRERVKDFIEAIAIDYNVSFVDNIKVDKLNIRNARFLSMRNAIDGLSIVPQYLLIDGDVFPDSDKLNVEIPHKCIVGGDNLYQSIAAASILAKCARDEYMINLSKKYPEYDWESNKGYGTKGHYLAIQKHGKTPYHRESFNLSISKTNHMSKGKTRKVRNLDKCILDDSDSEEETVME